MIWRSIDTTFVSLMTQFQSKFLFELVNLVILHNIAWILTNPYYEQLLNVTKKALFLNRIPDSLSRTFSNTWLGTSTLKSSFNSQSTSLMSCSARVIAWSNMSSNLGRTFGIFRTIMESAEVPPLVRAVMSAP